jgi:hypothetical protein
MVKEKQAMGSLMFPCGQKWVMVISLKTPEEGGGKTAYDKVLN